MNRFKINRMDLITIIKKNKLESKLFIGNFGLEKENLRVDKNGKLALTKHPNIFGDKTKNPYITTDFSESQIEMITPTFDTLGESYNFIDNLYNIVASELRDEYFWPGSMPPILPPEEEIPIAKYENHKEGIDAFNYRKKLAEKYGKKKQLICGIHYNFSFKDELLKILYKSIDNQVTFRDFKDEIYLKISRNYLRYGWILVYLFGSSVCVHGSCNNNGNKENKYNEIYLDYACSLRNGKYGYKNPTNHKLYYQSVKDYVNYIKTLINNKDIDSPAEFYNPIRLKGKTKKNILKDLLEYGIEYIEIRSLDVNPLYKNGIHLHDLYFVHMFILYCLFKEESEFNDEVIKTYSLNWELISSYGRQEDLELYLNNEEKITFKKYGLNILNEMFKLMKEIGLKDSLYYEIIEQNKKRIDNPNNIYSSKLFNLFKEKGYIDYQLEKAKEFMNLTKENEYQLIGYEDLELSTQILIKEAIKRGIKFTILDREENFILLEKDDKREYIKQATKTSLDSYITYLIMENKIVTKKILKSSGVNVPKGWTYNDEEEAINAYEKLKALPIVIKPKSTNYGVGITIFKSSFTKKDYSDAINLAFTHDKTIIIEEFFEGKEYRFLVIGDEVAGILHRVPANVVGDGIHTIEQLVNIKNLDTLRGIKHRKPLEKLNIGQVEKQFLKEQQKDIHYIPSKNEVVYLRENSNISTGGDSIDYTDLISNEYKEIAIKAAKSVGAKICGVDMIIKDINKSFNENNYSIIELNFNPAIHIHCYPYKGENRKIGGKILKQLGF